MLIHEELRMAIDSGTPYDPHPDVPLFLPDDFVFKPNPLGLRYVPVPSSLGGIRLEPEHRSLRTLFPNAAPTLSSFEATRFGRVHPKVTEAILGWIKGDAGFYALVDLDPRGLDEASQSVLGIAGPAELAISKYCHDKYLEALGTAPDDEGLLFSVYLKTGPAARGRVALEYWLLHR